MIYIQTQDESLEFTTVIKLTAVQNNLSLIYSGFCSTCVFRSCRQIGFDSGEDTNGSWPPLSWLSYVIDFLDRSINGGSLCYYTIGASKGSLKVNKNVGLLDVLDSLYWCQIQTYSISYKELLLINYSDIDPDLNGHDHIRLNTTNYYILNKQDLRNGLWYPILDCFWSGVFSKVYT